MNTYRLVWSPEGKPIGEVRARDARAARRKAPMPYRKFLGEIYAEVISTEPPPSERTRVIFRKFIGADALHGGADDVIALFPAIPGNCDPFATCQSYQHIGQHGAADVGLVSRTRPADRTDYLPLAAELRGLGYRLDIRARFTAADLRARIAAVGVS